MTLGEDITLKEIIKIKTAQCCRLEVSELNQVAISVPKGIEILTLDASSQTTELYRRSFIYLSASSLLIDRLRTPHNKFLWSLNFATLTKACLWPDATAIFSHKKCAVQTLDLKFSPDYRHDCYLAVLTNYGALNVFKNQADNWTSVCDVTKLWLDTCSPSWTSLHTWEQFQTQLGQGKITAISWTVHSNFLYLVAATLSGDLLVLKEDGSGFSFNFIVKSEILAGLKEPSYIHSFSLHGFLCIALGFFSGQCILLFTYPSTGEVAKKINIFNEEDSVPIKQIISTNDVLVINKTLYLVGYQLSSDGLFSSQEAQFDSSIVHIYSSGDVIYGALANRTVIKLKVPLLNTTQTYKLAVPNSINVVTAGILAISSSNLGKELFKVTVLADNNSDVRSQILQNLNRGRGLSDCADLLWLYKARLLRDNTPAIESSDENSKLRYWELQLLMLTKISDELKTKLTKNLDNLELALIQDRTKNRSTMDQLLSAASPNEVCMVCQGNISHRNIRMALCSNNHCLPRCCLSLKPCEPVNYTCCVLCGASASLAVLDGMETDSCPICDGYFRRVTSFIQ